ncbi:MAG: methylenetetrahydrofolate--tRNA-(uracil(54)-C(5))-methyltransferase (FADH(2)-oxidizing) TrmFO [Candidatus Tectomicrobia bacterium RIFCSPLOWO2_12_FULL_69_37]|nr:MAG: methylenetetrahydrofolate--tRNA-(uracil(54)-C(5))-methyltransferase (FADH(2)-oxidizing) TrmFO [Candidatus Tectomicrobia bacterium RIFCSPLOWO2_02_FULL_70_19]OGL66644.1 MAG: methylenetetrahydrofolate--tRNA-(uracil(54)-C(5))-methyltransferase (FADH(2)-oxidizing) TrmFO [Candidatus Tectomicrobia bacterium RIFCSPLOWO2_12_FULL_69_37]
MSARLRVIGGGLAGSEAAWQAAKRGVEVDLYEMRPVVPTPAHQSDALAELVCSNSLRSNSLENASGLLKEEMRRLDSLILQAADASRVPAGTALAVDRAAFSRRVTEATLAEPRVRLHREEVTSLGEDAPTILATGPLTSPALAAEVARLTQGKYLYFYDAISPILYGESIDTSVAFQASRYGKDMEEESEGDYLNIGLSEAEYNRFIDMVLEGEKIPLRDFEKAVYFEGCLPIEEMAARGRDTLAFGPMKPVGIEHPGTGQTYHAVVQLRREDLTGEFFSMVGFQTRLRYPEQKRIFAALPSLQNGRFLRYGSLHRNTYINAPRLMRVTLQLKRHPHLFVAGQIAGVEGYLESAAIGLLAGLNAAALLRGEPITPPPPTTALGALNRYIVEADPKNFQPMNVNFGLFPPLEKRVPRKERKRHIVERALRDLKPWIERMMPQVA